MRSVLQIPQTILIGFIRGYQVLISPVLPASCRFHPSCSEYAREAVSKHGAGKGSWLSLRRLGRCHPFHRGGYDPVP
ncbi:MAG: membrane protein insertion efficiency factor YidD [SAR324 cluster bacterium]|nr:membrane protein insertion efficiency factor YidD [SAR324 cluster bacterium]